MKSQPITIKTKAGAIVLEPANSHLLDAFSAHWPFDLARHNETGNGTCGIVFQHEFSEIWGVKFQCVETTKEHAERATMFRRVLLPIALADIAKYIPGVLIPCAYMKQKGPDSYEHGFAVFVSPEQGAKCRDLYKTLSAENYQQLWSALHSRSDGPANDLFHKAYWNLAREFEAGRELLIDLDIRPYMMMGEMALDFMVMDGRLVCLDENPNEEFPYWGELVRNGVGKIDWLPSVQFLDVAHPAMMFSHEDFVETQAASIRNGFGGIEIVVPGLIGTIVPGPTSIGWNGMVHLQLMGFQNTFSVDPRKLKRLERHPTSNDIQNNQALWQDRMAIAQKELGYQGMVAIGDRIITETEARQELGKACHALQNSLDRGVQPTEQKGMIKPILKVLRGFLAHPDAAVAEKLINALEANRTDAEPLAKTVAEILSWIGVEPLPAKRSKDALPPAVDGVEFINDTNFKKTKLVLLHKIACSIVIGVTFTKSQVEEKVETVRQSLDHGMLRDSRYATDQLLRNLIDVGYLARDDRGLTYWRKAK